MNPIIRKRSYLLLEVLGALLLICVCLFPLLKTTFVLSKVKEQEYHCLEQAVLQKNALAYLKSKLYQHQWPLSQLRKGHTEKFDLGGVVCLAHLQEHQHTEKTSLHRLGLLLDVDISCKAGPYCHHLIFIEGITP